VRESTHARRPSICFSYVSADPPTGFPRAMRLTNRKRRPKPDRRRALELLAFCRDGCTEALMLAHGFTIEQMVELVHAGIATASAEHVVAGKRTIEVARLRITEAGRRMLERAV
jgi:hypothetical protein